MSGRFADRRDRTLDRHGFRVDRVEGRLLGVCAGLARTTGIDVTFVRVAVVLGTLLGLGPVAVLAYLIAAWLGQDRRA